MILLILITALLLLAQWLWITPDMWWAEGAIRGITACLTAGVVRFLLLQITGWHIEVRRLARILLLLAGVVMLWLLCPPVSLWHWVVMLSLIAVTLIGLFRYHFTTIFMTLLSGVGGAFILY